MTWTFSVPASNDRGPRFLVPVLRTLHDANPRYLPVRLSLASHDGTVQLTAEVPPELEPLMKTQWYGQFPDGKITITPKQDPPRYTWSKCLHWRPMLLPLRSPDDFEDNLERRFADPLATLLAAISTSRKSSVQCYLTFTITPLHHHQKHRLEKRFHRHSRETPERQFLYWYLSLSPRRFERWLTWTRGISLLWRNVTPLHLRKKERFQERVAERLGDALFAVEMMAQVTSNWNIKNAAERKLREIVGSLGVFEEEGAGFRVSKSRRPFILTPKEAALLWHPATVSVQAATLPAVVSRELPPSLEILKAGQHAEVSILGETCFRGQHHSCGLMPEDRLRHIAITGKTGMGKSSLILQLLTHDIRKGYSVGLIDPHGDLCEAVLARIPKSRTNDVILLDAGDTPHPFAFNILHCPDPSKRFFVASGVLAAFRKVYGDAIGPRSEHLLRNALLAALEIPEATLLTMHRLLSDARYRSKVTPGITDVMVRNFWLQEFARMPDRLQVEATAPILNKLGHFVSSPLIRSIIGQPRSRIDLRQALDRKNNILLINLSKGRCGEDASALLGAFFVSAIQIAAMSRAEVPEAERVPFYLFVDEFQNFASSSFETILAEARKFKLGLCVANQFLSQVEEKTLAALFGNVGTFVTFAAGVNDSQLLADQLGSGIEPGDIQMLAKYHAYVRQLVAGESTAAYSLRTLRPAQIRNAADPEKIRRLARSQIRSEKC